MGNIYIFFQEVTLGIPHAIFERYHPGLLQYKAPLDITLFSHVLKPNNLTGTFQMRNPRNVSSFGMNIV